MTQFLLNPLTLSNINRFSKFFHCQNQEKICNNIISKDPTTPQVGGRAGGRTEGQTDGQTERQMDVVISESPVPPCRAGDCSESSQTLIALIK